MHVISQVNRDATNDHLRTIVKGKHSKEYGIFWIPRNGVMRTSVMLFVGITLSPTITDFSVVLEACYMEWCGKCYAFCHTRL